MHRLSIVLFCCGFSWESAQAQAPSQNGSPPVVVSASPVPAVPLGFTLKVNEQRVATIDATAVSGSDLAKALSTELKTPVRVSALVARRPVTAKLTGVPVETIFLALGPQVYIDYEVRWGRTREDWIGVEITGFNEREPKAPIQAKSFMVFAGSTDDEEATSESIDQEKTTADEEKLKRDPAKQASVLDVVVKDGLVSVRARRQMAAAIVLDAASKGHLGFETRGDLDRTLIDLDIRATPFDQLPEVMARPDIGVLMRRNLTTGSTRPVAVLLGAEATHVPKPAVSPGPAKVAPNAPKPAAPKTSKPDPAKRPTPKGPSN